MRAPKLPPSISALAGPLLIVVAVVVVLHDFVFGGKFTNFNPDVPTVFLMNHCFLGESLRAGTVPGWNPHPMMGTPFIADPQSGWMYLPAMLLYSALPCDVAIRSFIVLQPCLAGLGVYWLLRQERISRPAATAGGVVLALAISASKVLVTIPFPDAIAWSALLLPVVGKVLRASTWSGRFVWIVVAALVWGQIAAAHLSHGLVMGTVMAALYGIHVARAERKEGRLDTGTLATTIGVLAIALPVVNAAHLLPVIGYMQRATLGLGYDELQRIAADLRGDPVPRLEVSRALGETWPLRFATAPGLYLGALPLISAFAGFVARRTRPLAITFGVAALLFYVAGMERVIRVVAPRLEGLPLADFYRHSSGRFVYGALLAVVVLCAVGIDAWRDARSSRDRAVMLGPGLVVWGLLPFAAGVIPTRMALFAAGAVAAGGLLWIGARRPRLAWVIPVVLAVELGAGAVGGQIAGYRLAKDGLETATDKWLPFRPLPEATLGARPYIEGGPIEDAVDRGDDGRLAMLGEGLTWLFRPLLSDIEMPQGYNPVELDRYWRYVRSIVDDRLRYNMSIFPDGPPPANALDLLQIGWIGAEDPLSIPGAERVTADSRRTLYRLSPAPARASVVARWEVVATAEEALDRVTAASFDPSGTVVLEDDPGVDAPSPPAGAVPSRDVDYEPVDANRARLEVTTDADAVVLVRNAWDVNWTATVDGRAVDVLVADYFLQGIPVSEGEHSIELAYRDPNISRGLYLSALAVALLIGCTAVARTRERRV